MLPKHLRKKKKEKKKLFKKKNQLFIYASCLHWCVSPSAGCELPEGRGSIGFIYFPGPCTFTNFQWMQLIDIMVQTSKMIPPGASPGHQVKMLSTQVPEPQAGIWPLRLPLTSTSLKSNCGPECTVQSTAPLFGILIRITSTWFSMAGKGPRASHSITG